MSKPLSIHLLVPVWGDSYLDDYLSLSLPCQLSLQNLPALAENNHYKVHYHIVTDDAGREKITSHQSYQQLMSIVKVSFHELRRLESSIADDRNLWRRYIDSDWKKYALKMACLELGMTQAHLSAGVFIPLMSDIIISDGVFSYLLSQHEQGIDCVLVGSIRVKKEGFLSDSNEYFNDKKNVLAFPGKELVALSIKHIHPWSLQSTVDSVHFNNQWPDYIYWHLPNVAVIQRGNYCYPFLMDCRLKIEVPKNYTIDTMPLPYKNDKIHVVCDTQACMVMALEDEHIPPLTIVDTFNPLSVALFKMKETQLHHQFFSQHNVLFGDDQNPQVKEFIKSVKGQAQGIMDCETLLSNSTDLFNVFTQRVAVEQLGQEWLSYIPAKVDELIKNESNIIAFGGGTELNALLEYSYLKIVAIVDNDETKEGQLVNNVPVISVESIKNYINSTGRIGKQAVVIICSQRHQLAMHNQLVSTWGNELKILNPYYHITI
ncbi:hypothetical protein A9Q74_14150 [Colwellia sp. 39_35_sub15_T18]|nr:hypothetical protein A9Q74_14150 [Colwellia sp. 39_35_sub15_T18]